MKGLTLLALLVSLPALAQSGRLREIKSVADWGAQCDGIANDRVPIQSAINAAAAVGGGFSLKLPAGNCNIGAAGLVFPPNSATTPLPISIRGDSMSGTRILYTGTGTAISIGAAGSATPGAVTFEMRDLTVDTTGTSASTVNGIVLQNVRGGLIENVQVVGTYTTRFVGQSNTIANHWGLALLGGTWQQDPSKTDYSCNVTVRRVSILGNWQHGIEVDGYNTNKSNGYTFIDTRVYPFTGGGTPDWGVPNLPPASGGPSIGFHIGQGAGDIRFVGTNDVTGADIAFWFDGGNSKGEFRSERNSVSVVTGPFSVNNDIALDNFNNATDISPGASLPTLWQPSTAYQNVQLGWVPSGQYYVWSDNWTRLYRLTNAQNHVLNGPNTCTSGRTAPTGTGSAIKDGSCTWAYVATIVPPKWTAGAYPVGTIVAGIGREASNGFRVIKAGAGKSTIAPTSEKDEVVLGDGYAWSSLYTFVYGVSQAIGGDNLPGVDNSFRHAADIRVVPNPGGLAPGGVRFQNQNDGELWLQLLAGANANQAKRILFQRIDGTFWRINGDAVGTALTVDDGVATKLTFNSGTTLGNTVQFGTGAQLAPVPQASLAGTAAANGTLLYCSDCGASATCAVGGGTGRLAIRLNNKWSCVP